MVKKAARIWRASPRKGREVGEGVSGAVGDGVAPSVSNATPARAQAAPRETRLERGSSPKAAADSGTKTVDNWLRKAAREASVYLRPEI